MLKRQIEFLRKPSKIFALILAILLLVLSGVGYRLLAVYFKVEPIILPVPLDDFPKLVGDWSGEDLFIPTLTEEYMERNFADDYLSRRYKHNTTDQWFDIYVVYCSSTPAGMGGHRPENCYPGHGWIPDDTVSTQIITKKNRPISCLIHRFHKSAPMGDEIQISVLNFFILNGQITTDHNKFESFWGRKPNISRNPALYIAQVQISSYFENWIKTGAEEFTDLILSFLPDPNSIVQIEKNPINNILY